MFFFSANQMLMSALPIRVPVTTTLTALTVKVLTAVLVNKDSLEMEQFVKVSERAFTNTLHLGISSCSRFSINVIASKGRGNSYSFSIILDMDECSAESSPCDQNADCTNSAGSYSCTCKQGYTGNGTVCEGI